MFDGHSPDLSYEEYRYRASVVARAAETLRSVARELPGSESRASWSGPARDTFDRELAEQRHRLEGVLGRLQGACAQLNYYAGHSVITAQVRCD